MKISDNLKLKTKSGINTQVIRVAIGRTVKGIDLIFENWLQVKSEFR